MVIEMTLREERELENESNPIVEVHEPRGQGADNPPTVGGVNSSRPKAL